MEYDGLDISSGTDDDVPPSHRNRVSRGSLGNGRSSLVSAQYSRMHSDMEAQIHHLEQEAYCSVLRAFKAQSDALSWEKEGLITELRKELRVSDDEHRELLGQVNADDIIRKIRDWRLTGGNQAARLNSSQPTHEVLPSPSMSGSRKNHKTSQLGQILPPEDNSFYEAVITDYNPVEGRHALVYDQHTPNETWEWVNLKEIPADDIRWETGEPGIAFRGGYGVPRGSNRTSSRPRRDDPPIPGGGRGRGSTMSLLRKEPRVWQNSVANKLTENIRFYDTEALVHEGERLLQQSNPSPAELAKCKKMLRDQEQALVEALSVLPEPSDGGESDGEQHVDVETEEARDS